MILTPGHGVPLPAGLTLDPVARINDTRVKPETQLTGHSIHVSVIEGHFTHPLWLHLPTIMKGIPNYNEF